MVNCINYTLDAVFPVNPLTKRREVYFPEWIDNTLGLLSYHSSVNADGIWVNEMAQAKLQQIGSELASLSERPDYNWEFRLLSPQQNNAFCAPGGKVAFYRGLWETIHTSTNNYGLGSISVDDKIAAVMAHEASHAIGRHTARSIKFAALVFLVSEVAIAYLTSLITRENVPEDLHDVIYELKYFTHEICGLAGTLAGLWRSRAHETEADLGGYDLMKKAGRDPKAMIWVMRLFQDQRRPTGSDTLDTILELQSSHPLSSKREKALVDRWLQDHPNGNIPSYAF